MRNQLPSLAAKILLLLLALCRAFPAQASVLELTLPITEVAPGQSTTAILSVSNAVDLGALQFSLVHDPEVAIITDVVAADLLPNAMLEFNPEEGRCNIALVSTEPVSGTGPLLEITFVAVGGGGSVSDLTVQDPEAWEGVNNSLLDVVTFGGQVFVSGMTAEPAGPFPWRTIALVEGALLLLCIALFVWWWKRRRMPAAPKGGVEDRRGASSRFPNYCSHCGVRLKTFMRYCYKCGKALRPPSELENATEEVTR